MSEEQKKDLKIKIVVVSVILVLVGTIVALGPGLPKVLEYTREHKSEPWAPRWYYRLGQIFNATFRTKQAAAVYEEFLVNYEDDADQDFSQVLQREKADSDQAYYAPWLLNKKFWSQDKDVPKPILKVNRELLGKVMLNYAYYWEYDAKPRNYYKSRHLYDCLYYQWPDGSDIQQKAREGQIRQANRSF